MIRCRARRGVFLELSARFVVLSLRVRSWHEVAREERNGDGNFGDWNTTSSAVRLNISSAGMMSLSTLPRRDGLSEETAVLTSDGQLVLCSDILSVLHDEVSKITSRAFLRSCSTRAACARLPRQDGRRDTGRAARGSVGLNGGGIAA
jgi:hypothetical protein